MERLHTGVFWLLGSYAIDVLVDGQPRTDYMEVTRKGDGARGIIINALTWEQLCNVQVVRKFP